MENGNAIKTTFGTSSDNAPIDQAALIEASVCSNCVKQADCGILTASNQAIHQCELYECCSLPKPELVGAEKTPSTKAAKASFEENLHLLGLCANCDLRMNCKLPKPRAGVWHCEEYR